ncbi:hypothetical protein RIF29_42021 [Crotalaria pallida]|uniref:Uncharacterized protein n=1 Tax=Crotalaria pallida TaxID=3830 RepID=A0AAN9E657_CROPI
MDIFLGPISWIEVGDANQSRGQLDDLIPISVLNYYYNKVSLPQQQQLTLKLAIWKLERTPSSLFFAS